MDATLPDNSLSPVPPQVFISYSYDDEEHEKWVEALAMNLQSNGVKVRFDKWEVLLGEDIDAFMAEIFSSNYVLIICTEKYKKKADSEKDGVGRETIITATARYRKLDKLKIVPILRGGTDKTAMPNYLRNCHYLDWRHDNEYRIRLEELLRFFHKTPRKQPPELGPNPFIEGGKIRIVQKVNGLVDIEATESIKVDSREWPHSSPLWSSLPREKIVIFYGSWPKEKGVTPDAPYANRLAQFVSTHITKNVELFWWKDFEKRLETLNGASLISLGGPLSNPFAEAAGGRFVTHLDKQYASVTTDTLSGKVFTTPGGPKALWDEYVVVKCGQLNGMSIIYICGNTHFGNLGVVQAITENILYHQLFGNELFDFSAELTRDWLFKFTMRSREFMKAERVSKHVYRGNLASNNPSNEWL